jgi:glutamate carboxypeptidase
MIMNASARWLSGWSTNKSRWLAIASCLLLVGVTAPALGAAHEPVVAAAKKEKPALLETLKELCSIESGSADREGLDRIADLIAKRLSALGGKVEMIEPGPDTVRFIDTPEKLGKMVRATFTGKGSTKILLIAHMDTVYPRGMLAKQPFRIDGDRAYGLGIADDRHGIAVILHTLAILRSMQFSDHGTITVMINGDEEVNSPASRNHITRLGSEHDVVFSFEGGGNLQEDRLRLATSGIAEAVLRVKGRASHAGGAPEKGVNALYEMAHQVLQMRDLSNESVGLKVNWTMANSGIVRNMIPPSAQAQADIRVERLEDYDGIEQKLRERIKNKLLPESEVELVFERRFPPLQPSAAARKLAAHAQKVYEELGMKLAVIDKPTGGGTDAAFAALKAKGPVIESFGLRGFGSHSINAEYILLDSIEPRLYLATRMIMDVAQGKAPVR